MKFLTNHKSKIYWLILIVVFSIGYFIGKPTKVNTNHNDHELVLDKETGLWTCSMHPQIKYEEPGQCPICFMDLIPLEKSDGDENEYQISLSESAIKLAEIQTSKVVRKNAFRELRLSGRLVLNEQETYTISSDVNGRIEKMFVDFTGEKVNVGDPLYEIYSPELFAIQEELIQQVKLFEHSNNRILNSIRKKLELLGLTKSQIDKIEASQIANERITIYSKATGTAFQKLKMAGDYVKVGEMIYQISNLEKLWLNLEVYEQDIDLVQVGQTVNFHLKNNPAKEYSSKVEFIHPVSNKQTYSTGIRVLVENPGDLIPGFYANATLKSEVDASGSPLNKQIINFGDLPLLIPTSAPLLTGKRAIVFVKIQKDDKTIFEARKVKLGPKVGEYYVVLDGLQQNEEVVTSGNFKIDSAMQLEGKFSMMSMKDEKPEFNQDNAGILIPIYNHYFDLQESLMSDDFPSSVKNYEKFYATLKDLEITDLFNEKLLKWKSVSANIIESESSNFQDIDVLRENFEVISNNLIDMAKSFGNVGDLTFHEVYCPMAFGNTGASWLQREKQLANPYFGAKMLRCGTVKSTFGSGSTGE